MTELQNMTLVSALMRELNVSHTSQDNFLYKLGFKASARHTYRNGDRVYIYNHDADAIRAIHAKACEAGRERGWWSQGGRHMTTLQSDLLTPLATTASTRDYPPAPTIDLSSVAVTAGLDVKPAKRRRRKQEPVVIKPMTFWGRLRRSFSVLVGASA